MFERVEGPVGYTYLGGLHGGGGGKVYNGFEDTCEVDRWREREGRTGAEHWQLE